MTHPRQASLLQKAATLCRKMYAALPFGLRLADFLYRLAFDPLKDWGDSVYTLFLKRKVTGMPPIRGQDPLLYDVSGRKVAPPGYGRGFGHEVWRKLLPKYKDPELLQEALMAVQLKFWEHPEAIDEGTPLRRAEGLIITAIINWLTDYFRKRVRHREDSLFQESDEGIEQEFEVLDQESLRQLDDIISPSEWRSLMHQIDQIHPDASKWVDLMIEGNTSLEIVGDPRRGIPSMLPHVQQKPMSYQNWEANIKPKIKQILLRGLRHQH